MKRLKIRLALVVSAAALVSAGLAATAHAEVTHPVPAKVPANAPAVCAGIKLLNLGICA